MTQMDDGKCSCPNTIPVRLRLVYHIHGSYTIQEQHKNYGSLFEDKEVNFYH